MAHGATQVHFIYSSGEKARQKYLDDQSINIANDTIGCSDAKILKAKTMIDLAKESKVLKGNNFTSDKTCRDKLIDPLKVARMKGNSDGKFKSKVDRKYENKI